MGVTHKNGVALGGVSAVNGVAKASVGAINGVNVVPLAPPVNTGLPQITGPRGYGDTLICSPGTWSPAATSYEYEWRDGGEALPGETASPTEVPAEGGSLICYVRASNAAGASEWVRADSDEPRQLFISGDSKLAFPWIAPALQTALDLRDGDGKWVVLNVAVSGHTVAQMQAVFDSQVAPNIHRGWGVDFCCEYANNCTGIQGLFSGSDTADQLFAFGESVVAAGGFPVYATSEYPTGVFPSATGGDHNGTEAHIASELVRAGWGAHGGIALADFDAAAILANVQAGDGVHWDEGIKALLISKIMEAVDAAGLVGGCGDIVIASPTLDDGAIFSNPTYFYRTNNDLPHPNTATILRVTAGPVGTDLGDFSIVSSIPDFGTLHKTLYAISPAQSVGGLEGITFELI